MNSACRSVYECTLICVWTQDAVGSNVRLNSITTDTCQSANKKRREETKPGIENKRTCEDVSKREADLYLHKKHWLSSCFKDGPVCWSASSAAATSHPALCTAHHCVWTWGHFQLGVHPNSLSYWPKYRSREELVFQCSTHQSGSSKVSTKEDQSAAESYLYTGNSSSLAASTCTWSFQLPVRLESPPRDLLPLLHQAIASLTNAANFLNLIFQASELRETSVREDIEWYHALVRAMLEGDRPGLVRQAFLTFDADPTIQQPQLVLRASKGTTQDILLQDLTSAWSSFRPPAPDQSWFDKFKSSSPPVHALSKRVLLNDLNTLDTPKWARGDSYVINSSGVQWGEAPFLECVDGRFLPGWLLSLSVPFYGLKPDLNPEFRWVHFLAEMVSHFCVFKFVYS